MIRRRKLFVLGLTGGIASGKSTVRKILSTLGNNGGDQMAGVPPPTPARRRRPSSAGSVPLHHQRCLPPLPSSTSYPFLRTHTIDADILGHQCYDISTPEGKRTAMELAEIFGNDVLDRRTGAVDRKRLGELVFGTPANMQRLTDTVWPAISRLVQRELDRLAIITSEEPGGEEERRSSRVRLLQSEKEKIESGKETKEEEEEEEEVVVSAAAAAVDHSHLPLPPPLIVVLEAAVLLEAEWDKTFCDEIWTTCVPCETAIRRLAERNGLPRSAAVQRIQAQLGNAKRCENSDHVIWPVASKDELQLLVEGAWEGLKKRVMVKSEDGEGEGAGNERKGEMQYGYLERKQEEEEEEEEEEENWEKQGKEKERQCPSPNFFLSPPLEQAHHDLFLTFRERWSSAITRASKLRRVRNNGCSYYITSSGDDDDDDDDDDDLYFRSTTTQKNGLLCTLSTQFCELLWKMRKVGTDDDRTVLEHRFHLRDELVDSGAVNGITTPILDLLLLFHLPNIEEREVGASARLWIDFAIAVDEIVAETRGRALVVDEVKDSEEIEAVDRGNEERVERKTTTKREEERNVCSTSAEWALFSSEGRDRLAHTLRHHSDLWIALDQRRRRSSTMMTKKKKKKKKLGDVEEEDDGGEGSTSEERNTSSLISPRAALLGLLDEAGKLGYSKL